jgi:hypothetical protein
MKADDTAQKRKIGWLAKEWGGRDLPLKVLESAAGFYLGTADDDGPYSRESEEYWDTHDEAAAALEYPGRSLWTQRLEP